MLRFLSLSGLTPYEKARAFQKECLEKRIQDEIPDTVLFLEHTPVITQGRGLQFTGESRERHMPKPSHLPKDVEFCESERGGDLTYHGPGQLVIYPVVKLDGQGRFGKQDVSGFIRSLENLLIEELRDFDLEGKAHENATGVWVKDRKVASIGIAVKRWVTWHGMAINVVNDLKPFHLISPCGFQPEVMTRLQDLSPRYSESWGTDWRGWLEKRLAKRWGSSEIQTIDL